MTTQLRLLPIEPPTGPPTPDPAPRRQPTAGPTAASRQGAAGRGRPRVARARVTGRRSAQTRRAAHWSAPWRLDEHTREVGRIGIARARAALARARADHPADADRLRRAS